MIIHACGFVQFDTEKDFDKQVLEYADGVLRFEGDAIERPNRFPAVYKYHEPWDRHFCGYWELCEDSEPMMKAIIEQAEELLKIWKKVAEPIDSKQNL